MPITNPDTQDPEVIAKNIERLVKGVEKLRFSYEQYFLGFQKHEPVKERSETTRLITKLANAAIPNARMKFRLQQTIARFNSFSTYWGRILKDIEEGRHQRDLFRARIHTGKKQTPPTATKGSDSPSQQANAASDPYATLYNQYISARTKCKETTKGLTLDGFRKTMTTQMKVLQQKSSGGFRFQVTVEGGKSKIKAIPQKPPKATKK